MSNAPTDPEEAAVARAERRVEVLSEITEIALRLARAAAARAEAEGALAEGARAFTDISRAIRLTVTLEGKAEAGLREARAALRDAQAGVVREREGACARTHAARRQARDERESDIMAQLGDIAGEDPRELDERERDHFAHRLEEWLNDNEAWWNDPDRPVRVVIEHLCGYFHFSPRPQPLDRRPPGLSHRRALALGRPARGWSAGVHPALPRSAELNVAGRRK